MEKRHPLAKRKHPKQFVMDTAWKTRDMRQDQQ